ncbi:MAG: hypothetical protein FJX39_08470 [Alphaproteobacteria bacterium]|nr:hypothetical protein [Alphaproteobacteria bacterium]
MSKKSKVGAPENDEQPSDMFGASTNAPEMEIQPELIRSGQSDTIYPASDELASQRVSQEPVARALQTQQQLKILFFLTLIVGLIGGYFDNWVIPALSVLAYAVIGAAITRNESNIEKFADSLYYMGFLFTIWGLFFAFGPWKENVENLSSKTIITQFGIKLITTVIALTARIIIIQYRTSFAEQIEEPHAALAQMAEMMTVEIKRSILSFRRARDQLLKEAQIGIADANKKALEAMDQVLKEAQLGVNETNKQALNAIEANLREFRQTTERLLISVSASLEDLLKRLNSVDVPKDVIASRLNSAAQAIATDMAKLQEIVQVTNTGVSKSLAEALDRIEGASKRFDGALIALANIDKLASHSQITLENIDTSSKRFDETIRNSTKLLSEFANTLIKFHAATSKDVSKFRGLLATAAEITSLSNIGRHLPSILRNLKLRLLEWWKR